MKNIILVGMPACGKSTVGVVLAKTVGKDFVDTDILIQQREGKTLQEIIDAEGNDAFHGIEEDILVGFEGENTVISTGGSAIYFPKAIEHFKKKGIIVYLKVSLDTILERLDNIKTRGVTLNPGQTMTELYEERVPLYEKNSDLIIEADRLSIEDVIEKIIEMMGEEDD